MLFLLLPTVFFSFAAAAPKAPRSLPPAAPKQGCLYNVANVGLFNTHQSVDFSQVNSVPSWIHVNQYTINANPPASPYARQFCADNVRLTSAGVLALDVNGTSSGPIRSSEMQTSASNVLYGSVRTVARVSHKAGTTNAMFFYHNDQQESDIEICTDNTDTAHFTNQNVRGNGPSTTRAIRFQKPLSDDFHEYRLDWLSDRTDYYIDGVLRTTLRKNVPSVPTQFMWNHWSNGGSWSGGPPTDDSTMKIRSIDAYFNVTSGGGC